jgi:3-deoxy-manno-octulosonate cytidylyltransferase (CMP-KDO synthetase)
MVLAVIPARWASTRFPGKPLANIAGKSMIQRVLEQVNQSERVDRAIVATDDARILQHVLDLGEEAMMTSPEHPSGTDRCADVAQHFPEAHIILNVQGDEPFIQPAQIDLLADTLLHHSTARIATLAKKIERIELLTNPNIVKMVFSNASGAIYFSRHPIPYLRGVAPENWLEHQDYYKHIGLYGFRRDALMEVASLSLSPLEKAESLEQLRWLEHGIRIAVGITEWETLGVDTPEDLEGLSEL